MSLHPTWQRRGRTAPRQHSPQRIAAAKRAIARDIDNNALTPELVKPENASVETHPAPEQL